MIFRNRILQNALVAALDLRRHAAAQSSVRKRLDIRFRSVVSVRSKVDTRTDQNWPGALSSGLCNSSMISSWLFAEALGKRIPSNSELGVGSVRLWRILVEIKVGRCRIPGPTGKKKKTRPWKDLWGLVMAATLGSTAPVRGLACLKAETPVTENVK